MVHAKVVTVENTAGTAIEIEIISLDGDDLTYRLIRNGRAGAPGVMSMGLLNEKSQMIVRAASEHVLPPLPDYEIDLVVNSRRKDKGVGDWILQNVGGEVRVRNNSPQKYAPATKLYIVYFGEHRRYSDRYAVLHRAEFDVSTPSGDTEEFVIEPVVVEYDSDNKGAGNFGGCQYCGLICVIKMADGRIVLHDTQGGIMKVGVKSSPQILQAIQEYQTGDIFDGNLLLEQKMDNFSDNGAGIRQ